jgi:nucleoside 2-deoxyribosyltransferase
MPRLWELTNDKSREALRELAAELGMQHFDPDRQRKFAEVEPIDEIAELMQESPGFEKNV